MRRFVAILLSILIIVLTVVCIGYMISPIDSVSVEKTIRIKESGQLLDISLISGYLFLGLYFLGAYFQTRKDHYQVYFSLYCLLQGVYISTLHERLFNLVFPAVGLSLLTTIQLYLIHISVLFFLLFMLKFFKEYASRSIIIILSALLSMQVLLFGMPSVSEIILGELAIPTKKLLIIMTTGICHLYITVILVKAFKNKMEGSEYVLVIVTVFVCYSTLLGLNFLYDMPISWIHLLLFVVMMMSLALLMGHRYHMAYEKVEKFSEDLLLYDRLKNDFLVKTSNKLEPPLQEIMALTQSLLEGKAGPLKIKQQEGVMLIHDIGKRVSFLANDLLNISNIKQSQLVMNPSPVHVKIIQDIIEEIQLLLPASYTVKIQNKITDDLPLLFVDQLRLKQILFHLLNNAIKYTSSGMISVSAEVQDEYMHISITDTGVGMEKKHLAHIFSPFYQVKNEKEQLSNGLGIGLSITKQLVEAAGGEISVRSAMGLGSTFTFTIPLAKQLEITSSKNKPDLVVQEAEQLAAHFFRRQDGALDTTVLLVDDDVENLENLMPIIAALHYSVIAVNSGKAALNIIQNEPIDLLIVNLMMPTMTGYELCKIVRENHSMMELPIVILTSGTQSADLVITMKAGANSFLRKPIHSEELRANVVSLIEMKQAAQMAVHEELSYFYAQIAPHFLHNTLNTIIALTYTDSEKAREALLHLSTYFRAKLDYYQQNSMVSLAQELEFVQAYVAIEQMRFGDKLAVRYDIDENIELYLPAMSIQPLVENAIRHGISPKKGGGTLSIIIQKELNNIRITVEDDGVGIPKEKKDAMINGMTEGIGLTNSLNKLKSLKRAQVLLESKEGLGTKISIILPEG